MQRAQLQGTFNKIDPSGRGLNRGQLEVLCAALGQPKDSKKIDKIFYELGVPDNAGLTFDLFYDYWTSDVGVALM